MKNACDKVSYYVFDAGILVYLVSFSAFVLFMLVAMKLIIKVLF